MWGTRPLPSAFPLPPARPSPSTGCSPTGLPCSPSTGAPGVRTATSLCARSSSTARTSPRAAPGWWPSSPQIPDESLTLTEKHDLAFPVLSDLGSKTAERYGLAFDLSDELGALYDTFGFDLQRVNGGHSRTLPLPATYVIDRDGTIRWAFVDTDYTVRAEPADILAALDTLG